MALAVPVGAAAAPAPGLPSVPIPGTGTGTLTGILQRNPAGGVLRGTPAAGILEPTAATTTPPTETYVCHRHPRAGATWVRMFSMTWALYSTPSWLGTVKSNVSAA
jgi:hypothetical protein